MDDPAPFPAPHALDAPVSASHSAVDFFERVNRHVVLGQHSRPICVLGLKRAKAFNDRGIEYSNFSARCNASGLCRCACELHRLPIPGQSVSGLRPDGLHRMCSVSRVSCLWGKGPALDVSVATSFRVSHNYSARFEHGG